MSMPNILQGFGLEMILIAVIGYLWFQGTKIISNYDLVTFENAGIYQHE